MSYPPSLTYGLSAINGVTVNNFKVQAHTTSAVSSGGSIRFTLPTNALVHFKKVSLNFCVETTGTATAMAGSRIPEGHMLFNRMQVTAGGVPLSSGVSNLNVLRQILKVVHGHDSNPVTDHSNIIRDKSDITFIDMSGAVNGVNENLPAKDNATWLSMSLGPLFDTIEPAMVSTDLLPEIQVEIFLANSNVVVKPLGGGIAQFTTNAGTLDGDFNVNNYHLNVPCYSISDAIYESMLDKTIERDNYLVLSYKEYYNFSDTFSGASLFTSGVSCLNRIMAVYRNTGYDTQGAPKRIAGSTDELGLTGRGTDFFQDKRTSNEAYVSKQARFTAPLTTNIAGSTTGLNTEGIPSFSYRVNSVQMPNYNVPAPSWYHITCEAMGVDKMAHCESQVEFLEDKYIQAIRLCLPNDSVRVLSGLDSRGSSTTMRLNCDNTAGNLKTSSNVEIYLEATQQLRVGQGRMLQTIA